MCAGAVQACSAGAAPCAVILINPGGSGGRSRGVGEALIKLTIFYTNGKKDTIFINFFRPFPSSTSVVVGEEEEEAN